MPHMFQGGLSPELTVAVTALSEAIPELRDSAQEVVEVVVVVVVVVAVVVLGAVIMQFVRL